VAVGELDDIHLLVGVFGFIVDFFSYFLSWSAFWSEIQGKVHWDLAVERFERRLSGCGAKYLSKGVD